jgi:hypothetical protein
MYLSGCLHITAEEAITHKALSDLLTLILCSYSLSWLPWYVVSYPILWSQASF